MAPPTGLSEPTLATGEGPRKVGGVKGTGKLGDGEQVKGVGSKLVGKMDKLFGVPRKKKGGGPAKPTNQKVNRHQKKKMISTIQSGRRCAL